MATWRRFVASGSVGSVRSTRQPMSENTLGYMYARNGYSGRHVPHGWRATFSTIMNERAKLLQRPDDREIIDAMLAHKPKGMSGSEFDYNRALYMPQRRALAQEWADLLMCELAPAAALLNAPEAPVAEPAYVPSVRVRNATSAGQLIAAMETAFLPFTGQWLAAAAQPADVTLAWATMRRTASSARTWGGPVSAWPGWPP